MIMNTDLLKQLYCIFSPSGNTKKMRRFLKREIAKRGAAFVQDTAGNLLVTKGVADEYPCLASHIDQVRHHTHPKDFRCIESGGVVMGWSDKIKQQCGLGADDKNGIYICLNALERFDVLKVAFFADEEIGCVGSSQADMSFFDDVRFVIEPDRMHGNDFISFMSGLQVCSDDFIEDSCYSLFGYKTEQGSVTDVLTLLENGLEVSCLNLSCGYYNPHTDQEVTVLAELDNCQRLVFHIIGSMERKYPFRLPAYSWGRSSYCGKWAALDDMDEDHETMIDLLSWDRGMTFEQLIEEGWDTSFHEHDHHILRQMMDEVKDGLYGYAEDADFEEI